MAWTTNHAISFALESECISAYGHSILKNFTPLSNATYQMYVIDVLLPIILQEV